MSAKAKSKRSRSWVFDGSEETVRQLLEELDGEEGEGENEPAAEMPSLAAGKRSRNQPLADIAGQCNVGLGVAPQAPAPCAPFAFGSPVAFPPFGAPPLPPPAPTPPSSAPIQGPPCALTQTESLTRENTFLRQAVRVLMGHKKSALGVIDRQHAELDALRQALSTAERVNYELRFMLSQRDAGAMMSGGRLGC